MTDGQLEGLGAGAVEALQCEPLDLRSRHQVSLPLVELQRLVCRTEGYRHEVEDEDSTDRGVAEQVKLLVLVQENKWEIAAIRLDGHSHIPFAGVRLVRVHQCHSRNFSLRFRGVATERFHPLMSHRWKIRL